MQLRIKFEIETNLYEILSLLLQAATLFVAVVS